MLIERDRLIALSYYFGISNVIFHMLITFTVLLTRSTQNMNAPGNTKNIGIQENQENNPPLNASQNSATTTR